MRASCSTEAEKASSYLLITLHFMTTQMWFWNALQPYVISKVFSQVGKTYWKHSRQQDFEIWQWWRTFNLQRTPYNSWYYRTIVWRRHNLLPREIRKTWSSGSKLGLTTSASVRKFTQSCWKNCCGYGFYQVVEAMGHSWNRKIHLQRNSVVAWFGWPYQEESSSYWTNRSAKA